MKRLLTIALSVILTASLSAQGNITSFLGIPVNGTKAEVTQRLIEQGAVKVKDGLQISGIDQMPFLVRIKTHKGKVYSISLVETKGTKDVKTAVARFNSLIDSYRENTCEYTEYEYNSFVVINDETSTERHIHEGDYYAEFFQVADPQLYNRKVGFTITDEFGDYRIERIYDNIYNMPEGK